MKKPPVKPNIDDYIDPLTQEPDDKYFSDLEEWWQEFAEWDSMASDYSDAKRKGEV